MTQDASTNRWIVLVSSVLINLCIGAAYAWSVFQKPLITMFGWTSSEASLAFALSLGLVPIAMIVAGKIQDQQGPKLVIMAGGLLYSAGIVGASFTSSLTWLYLTYGLMGGFGIGAVYACTVANTVKWFPDKRGLASGLVAAGFGSGAVLIAPLATLFIQFFGVLHTFMILGIAFLVVISVAALFVKTAPPGYVPAGWTPPVSASGGAAAGNTDKNWREMLKTPLFYVLWGMYAIGAISGLMIIGHASPIGQEIIGLTPALAAVVVMFLAITNTAGRIFWGWVSDKIGWALSIIMMFIVATAMMLAINHVGNFVTFSIVVLLIGLCFGGFMGIFPSITATAFGSKNLGMNYGIIFTAYGAAAMIGPRLAARVKEMNNGDYSVAFYTAAALSVLGIVLTVIAWRLTTKAKRS